MSITGGIGGVDVSYPECLYKSNYIGAALFFDEPMVGTRDRVVKPKLQKDPALRKTLTPQKVLQDFKGLYHETKYVHGPTSLLKGLAARKDVDLGDMDFLPAEYVYLGDHGKFRFFINFQRATAILPMPWCSSPQAGLVRAGFYRN